MSSWSARPSAVRIAVATTAALTLGIIAACSEGGVAKNIAGPSSPSVRLGVLPSIANAKLATVCVNGPAGAYVLQNSGFIDSVQYGGSVKRYDNGTPGFPAAGAQYTLNVAVANTPKCEDILVRQTAGDAGLAGVGNPGYNPGHDPFSLITVTLVSTPAGSVVAPTSCDWDPGDIATAPCATSPVIHANTFHGSKTTFNAVAPVIGTPQFVVGDLASGLQLAAALKGNKKNGNTLNFWGSQWWKNNPMSKYSDNGWPSFKGYATTAGTCGETWTSRVGNSPPPPATIADVINVIVTDKVWKDGPDLRGNILAIISVAQDGGYGPNPGHDGNGPMVELLCGSWNQQER